MFVSTAICARELSVAFPFALATGNASLSRSLVRQGDRHCLAWLQGVAEGELLIEPEMAHRPVGENEADALLCPH